MPIQLSENIVTNVILAIISKIKEALHAIKDLIAQSVPDSFNKLQRLCTRFYIIFGSHEKSLCFTFILMLYFIVISCFLLDVFLFFKLTYFYKSLILLRFPIIFHVWLHFITDLTSNMELIEEKFQITHRFLPDGRDDFISFKKRRT